jgi:hypothetical protein|uniref:Transposase, OrfB family protein n=1 Tax=uncultured haloarchaeon TaxID=160804 RepID=A0A0K1YBP8_9EURY|nr:transposase, OrfB family protein [uncultured haloarchaeon]
MREAGQTSLEREAQAHEKQSVHDQSHQISPRVVNWNRAVREPGYDLRRPHRHERRYRVWDASEPTLAYASHHTITRFRVVRDSVEWDSQLKK